MSARSSRPLAVALAAALEPIAAARSAASAKPKEWLDQESPALLAQDVKVACGPEHDGSCSEAFARLQASGAKGPAVDEATRVAEAEQRRVYPLRTQGERFLRVFATVGQKQKAFAKCRADKGVEGSDPDQVRSACADDVLGTDPDDKRYQARKNDETLFRRLSKQIADPALARDLEARKGRALDEGVATSADVPKPRPATTGTP